MSGSAVLFSGMAMLIRYAVGVSFFTTALFRFTIGVSMLGTLALCQKIRLEFHNRLLLFLRGLFGGFGVVLFYLAIVKIGIAKGTVISHTFPVFATLGGVLFLKDRVRPLVWLSLVVSLVGLSLLTRSTWSNGFAGQDDLWVALAFVGAVMGGAAIVCVKRLRATDSSASIFMSQSLIGFWIVLVPANLTSSPLVFSTILVLVGVGVLAPGQDGKPVLHIHAALGRSGQTMTGCLRPGVTTWLVGEVILYEIVDAKATRVKDKVSGFALLEPGASAES